jgi:imidazolonepropionase-like amidohydrolase/ABC-type multidrug transport system permease subunit
MKPYLALIRANLRLALRERVAIFFNYVFPLIFFFAFGGLLHAERGGVITHVVTMVLVIGILGNGLFGGGIRAVQDREQNILRRFKVAPISAAPILAASIVTGWVLYLPAVVLTFVLARVVYGMPFPERWFSLFVLVSAGVIAFRAIGLIIASVANSAQESQILVQLVYLPMMFLSGTTFSITILPAWAQTIAQFLPATYLVNALQSNLLRAEAPRQAGSALFVLLVTAAVSLFLSTQLFRWEKEEKLRRSGKLALAAMIVPSLLLGAWQVRTHDAVSQTRVLYRQMQRGRSLMIRGVRIFTGDGRVIDSGAVLVRSGIILQVYPGAPPEDLNAESIEGSGKTLLPGLIDMRVQLTTSGGVRDLPGSFHPAAAARRALAAYLYCGATGVRSVGDPPALVRDLAAAVAAGERLGAQVFTGAGTVSNAYIPSLSILDAAAGIQAGDPALLSRTLVEQVGPLDLIRQMRKALGSGPRRLPAEASAPLHDAMRKLVDAYRSGALLVAGSGAGSPMVWHGPSVQRELELWVQAGIPARDALLGATSNAARVLGLEARIGAIRNGCDADLLLVDGNPLEDIAALERVSAVIFKGEPIDRSRLFDEQ